jgi:hypothetical protein
VAVEAGGRLGQDPGVADPRVGDDQRRVDAEAVENVREFPDDALAVAEFGRDERQRVRVRAIHGHVVPPGRGKPVERRRRPIAGHASPDTGCRMPGTDGRSATGIRAAGTGGASQ